MIATFRRMFLDHPQEVGETYFQHMGAAFRYGFRLMSAAGCCFIHGLAPGLHRTTASDRIKEMAAELNGRAQTACEERMRRAGVYDPGL